MIKYLFPILIILFSFGRGMNAFGQGCSDAGVCSIGALGVVKLKFEKLPYEEFKLGLIEVDTTEGLTKEIDLSDTSIKNEKDSTFVNPGLSSKSSSQKSNTSPFSGPPKFVFTYKSIYGRGDNETDILTHQLEAIYFLYKNKLSAQVKLPYQTINGDLGTVSGLGDVTASLSYSLISKPKKIVSIVGGVKIPVNNADLSKNNLALPMVYQTSLGTNDVLFGFNYRIKTWDLTVAYQHPFNANKNQYLNDASQSLEYNGYFESRNLSRADDAVLRLNKMFNLKKVSFSTGLLGIYHMNNDKFENFNGQTTAMKGSKGLTLNLNLSSVYAVSKKVDLMLIYASPMVTRDARPAGLARKFVFMAGVRLKTF